MITIDQAIAHFPKRLPDTNKSDFGHILVIAGSTGYTGAAYLTSQAALLSGSGLVTLAVGKSIYPIMAAKMDEVMVRPFFETKDASLSLFAEKDLMAFAEKCTALVVGPGISQNKETQTLVRNIIRNIDKPVVLDADGINAFAGEPALLKSARAKLILTPHPGEMARLTGVDVDAVQKNRKDVALEFVNEYNTVLVLKGHETVVVNPAGDFYLNQTGNPGMATGGTGDVLAGMIASFVGQRVDLFYAAVLGVYFHGLAGDLAAKEKGMLSTTATDLLNRLPEVLRVLA